MVGSVVLCRVLLELLRVGFATTWLEHVNAPQTKAELLALRRSIDRGTPFGDERWQRRMANRLGLEASLRPRGRPRNQEK